MILTLLMTVGIVAVDPAHAQQWQEIQPYQADTIRGGVNARAWSPMWGNQTGAVFWQNGQRYTQAGAQNHKWHADQVNWMRANSGTLSIAFHIFDQGVNCSADWVPAWGASNLPGFQAAFFPIRRCGAWLGHQFEIRLEADRNRIAAGVEYWAQGRFRNDNPRDRAKVPVDTYWNNDGNYHQHYCVFSNNDDIGDRNACQ